MTVITSLKEFKGREKAHDWKNVRTYKRCWLAVCNTPFADATEVEDEFCLRTLIVGGTFYYTPQGVIDTGAIAKQLHVVQDSDDGLNWMITVDYGNMDATGSNETCPWKKPSLISWDYYQVQRNMDYDIYNKPVLNAAGEPYADPLTVEINVPMLCVEQNEMYFDDSIATRYSNCLNSNTFLGCSPGTLKAIIKGKREYDAQWGFFFPVSYQFLFNPNTWDRWVLEKGYRCLKDGKLQNILINGVVASTPQLLDTDGAVLDQNGTPVFTKWELLPRVPYNFNFR